VCILVHHAPTVRIRRKGNAVARPCLHRVAVHQVLRHEAIPGRAGGRENGKVSRSQAFCFGGILALFFPAFDSTTRATRGRLGADCAGCRLGRRGARLRTEHARAIRVC